MNIEVHKPENLPLNILIQNIYGLRYVSLLLIDLKAHRQISHLPFIYIVDIMSRSTMYIFKKYSNQQIKIYKLYGYQALPVLSQKGPTKLVAWIFGGQSRLGN